MGRRQSGLSVTLSPGSSGILSVRRRKKRDDKTQPLLDSGRDRRTLTPAYIFNSAGLNNDHRKKSGDGEQSGVVKDVLVGVINSAVLLPTMVGFTSIIYGDEFFTEDGHDYFPTLLKLVFFSSTIHQLCFLCFSSLPFAVGQVQDAGLIFLSNMAATVVANMKDDFTRSEVMSTVLFTLAISTAFLGLSLMLIGYLKLASTVQYLPLPVVGGYLAFIGLFCGESGLRLMVNRTDIVGISGLVHLLNIECLRLAAPGIVAAASLFFVAQKVENKLVLPALLFSFPVIFYLVLLATGGTLEDARTQGWVKQASDVPPCWHVFELFDFSKAHLGQAFPAVLPDLFAMCAVVAFGSCLDVAAIQFEMGKPLNYDHELKSVGASNFISGLLGGYTGSYIFSQSIFALRNGVNSRAASIAVAVTELMIFLFPIDLLGILPRFFFGCVLLFVAADMLLDWLVIAYFKVDFTEYLIIVITFVAINMTSLVTGMAAGSVAAAINFAFVYSRMSNVQVLVKPASNIIRSVPDRAALDSQRERIVALKLDGFQFFGSTTRVLAAVEANISEERQTPSPVVEPGARQRACSADEASGVPSRARAASHGINDLCLPSNDRSLERPLQSRTTQVSRQWERKATRFVVLDCTDVPLIDATAARGCFLTLLFLLQEKGIDLVFAGLSTECKRILQNHDVISLDYTSDDDIEENCEESDDLATSFETLNAALEWCENVLCRALYVNPKQQSTLSSLFSKSVAAYFSVTTFGPYHTILQSGQNADAIYVVEKGSVAITGYGRSSNAFNTTPFFGHVDFFRKQPIYSFNGTTGAGVENGLFVLTRSNFNKMLSENPQAAAEFERTVLQAVLKNF